MVKSLSKPSRSMSRRRIRTQAEWKVEAQTSLAVGAQPGGQPVLQLPCRLVGEGDGDDLPGPGRVHGAEPPGPADLLLRRAGRGSSPESADPPPWPSRAPRPSRCPGRRSAGCTPAGSAPWSCRCRRPPAAAAVPPWSWRPGAAWGSAGLQILGDDRPPGGDVALFEVFHTVHRSPSVSKVSAPILRQNAAVRSTAGNAAVAGLPLLLPN